MRPRWATPSTLVLILALAETSPVSAQAEVGLAVAAGVGMPTSDFGSAHKGGYLGNARVFIYPGHSRVGVQVDLAYGRFAGQGGNADFKPFTAMGSLLFGSARSRHIRPYFLAGAGLMAKGSTMNEYSRFAVQGGAGLSIGSGSISAFLEARYVSSVEAITLASYVPILAGVVFHLR